MIFYQESETRFKRMLQLCSNSGQTPGIKKIGSCKSPWFLLSKRDFESGFQHEFESVFQLNTESVLS